MRNFLKASGGGTPGNLPLPKALRDLADKDPESRFVIYERNGIKKKYLSEIPASEALDIAGSIESVLSSEYGGGTYEVNLVNRDSEVKGKYSYEIGGSPKGKRKSSSSEEQETPKGKSKKSTTDEAFYRVLDKLADAAISQKTSSAEELNRNLQMMKELKSDDGDYREMVNQLIGGVIQNAFSGQSSSFEEILRAVQLLKEVSPQIQPEDTMTSVVNLLGTIFASKLGGGQAQFTPDQVQMIQRYIPQFAGQQPLPPGQTQAQPQPQAQQLAGTQPQTTPQPQPQTPARDISQSSNEAHRRFYYVFIDPIRRAITGGESDYDIAKKIIDMMEYSVDYMSNDPHPLVAGMVRNMDNPVELNKELYKFFDSIPELAGMKERQNSIQVNIVAIYTGAPDTEITGQPEENLTGTDADSIGQPEPAQVHDSAKKSH